ncbi:S41 family peptidase [Myroides sp. N17-2]|uniref:S41 family peptidase n=1 Tax=Myroides sp. N17-2 TaxID=2030799 RepID=UPI001304621F|nr:S41 family peptidase [Myroides sp. N17-2]
MKLYSLVDEVDDYHNEIYGNTPSFKYEDIKDESFLTGILNEPRYNFYPKSIMNLDSLETVLSKKMLTDYEGIYYYKEYFKLAIIQKSATLFEGIILDTKIPSWRQGETILYLVYKGNNRFRLFSGKFIDKQLISTIDHFRAGRFLSLNWEKERTTMDYYNVGFPTEPFTKKELNAECTYIKLGSFDSSNKGIKDATAFYNSIKDNLISKNLILDLRNNSGGGDKSSAQFYNLFKKFKGNIYVLVNFNTISNAEQFTLKLKKFNNVMVLGDNTRGMLTYGRNYAVDKVSSSALFRIHFTDINTHWREYLPYEGKGVTPDFYLSSTEDWIEQVVRKYCE